MHSFLRAIGFRSLTKKKELQELFDKIIQKPDDIRFVPLDEESNVTVLTRKITPNMGICLCGELDDNGKFRMEYYYPYLNSQTLSTTVDCVLKKQGEKDSYAGLCEDYRVGISLIFYLTNVIEMREKYSHTGVVPKTNGVQLAALAQSGKILLPVKKTEKQAEASKTATKKRSQMIEAAKNGDTQAMENLTIEEMDLFSRLNQQIGKTDLYTLVESFFMPYGVECDQYSIMGEIEEIELIKNKITEEEVYCLSVNCNDIVFCIAVNKEDLLGVPAIGRRFKGKIWMQGNAIYE